jgi:hypothetical protein
LNPFFKVYMQAVNQETLNLPHHYHIFLSVRDLPFCGNPGLGSTTQKDSMGRLDRRPGSAFVILVMKYG